MIPVLFDTNAYSAIGRAQPDAVAVLRSATAIGLSVVTLCELRAGFASGSRADQNRAELATFLRSDRVRVFPVDEATTEFYATIHAQLRRIGQNIPTNDVLIAACAMQHGIPVFTFDDHFTRIVGLRVVRKASDLGGNGQTP